MSSEHLKITNPRVKSIDDLEQRDMLKLVFISIQDLIALEQAQIPKGESLDMKVSVTSSPTFINENYILPDGNNWYGPWIRVDIFNNGPNPVYRQVNNEFNRAKYATLNANETIAEDLRTARIKSVTLYCDVGNTATVRLFFKR